MKKQQEISNEKMKEKVGQKAEVLIEDISFDKKYLIGRTRQDVPDVDGVIYVENTLGDDGVKLINSFIQCEVTGYMEYDLIGKLLEK